MKINCTKCGSIKPASEFYKDRRLPRRSFLYSWCKICHAKNTRDRRNSTPENIARDIAKSKKWHKDNPEKSRRGRRCAVLRKKYGISVDDYEEILAKQGGGCAICGATDSRVILSGGRPSNLHVDHNHKTNKVRGLLCQPCNVSLGHMSDSPERLR